MNALHADHLLHWLGPLQAPARRVGAGRHWRAFWRIMVEENRRLPTSTLQWLRVGGLLIWGAVGCHTVVAQRAQVQQALARSWPLWFAELVAFGLAYGVNTGERAKQRGAALTLIAVQSALALAALWTSQNIVACFLFVPVAGQLALLEWKAAKVTMIVVQLVGMTWVSLKGYGRIDKAFFGMSYLAFQFFADVLCWNILASQRARRELLRAMAEKKAAQDLLAQSSRLAERLRISRELHDLLGHHLTALSLHLEVAGQLAEGRLLSHVQQAQGLAKLLLGDVRAAVSTMREEPGLNLEAALLSLTREVLQPQIHLEIPASLGLDDPDRAHALLRCVQEIVTNTLRHAGASNLWIEVLRVGSAVEVRARDDGRGAANPQAGNGLSGLAQRLAQFGGTLELASTPERGFRTVAHIPLDRRAP